MWPYLGHPISAQDKPTLLTQYCCIKKDNGHEELMFVSVLKQVWIWQSMVRLRILCPLMATDGKKNWKQNKMNLKKLTMETIISAWILIEKVQCITSITIRNQERRTEQPTSDSNFCTDVKVHTCMCGICDELTTRVWPPIHVCNAMKKNASCEK